MSVPWLSSKISEVNNFEKVYSLDEIAKDYDVTQIEEDGYLVLTVDEHHWVKFAVMQFSYSDPDGEDTHLSLIFHGEGPSGSLGELRHTHWGEDGYVFYPNYSIINAAFKHLGKYFDIE